MHVYASIAAYRQLQYINRLYGPALNLNWNDKLVLKASGAIFKWRHFYDSIVVSHNALKKVYL